MGFMQALKNIGTKTPTSEELYKDIPTNILELMWFKDGKYKNCEENIEKRIIDIKVIEDMIITVYTEYNKSEPSLISIKDKIKKPTSKVDKLGYYPSYKLITPEQRWTYINWLKNIKESIDIGYVFLFYYGLERYLFTQDYINAWNTIYELRKYHKNKSFISYSTNALIASCMLHDRQDLFVKLLEGTDDINDIYVSDLYLLAKYKLYGDITAEEIMAISSKVGFTKRTYIKNQHDIFKEELTKTLIERFNKNGVSLHDFNLKKSPTTELLIIANFSMNENIRVIQIPSLIENKQFRTYICDILSETHEAVKLIVKNMRKLENNKPIKTQPNDNVDNENILFEALDTNMFDKNEEYYINSLCPSCNEEVNKMPASKSKCSKCNEEIIVKKSIFTNEKIALNKEQSSVMEQIKNELSARKNIYKIISKYKIDIITIKNEVDLTNTTIEHTLIEKLETISNEYRSSRKFAKYRNVLLEIANLNKSIEKLEEALKLYIGVWYYNINGATDDGPRFDKRNSDPSTKVIKEITNIIDVIKLNKDEVLYRFRDTISKYEELGMVVNNDMAWEEFSKSIYGVLLLESN